MTTFSCLGLLIFMHCQLPKPPKPTVVVCPPVVAWSEADQRAAGLALEQLPPGHPLRTMAVVTVKQRDINRACQRSKGRR